MNRPIVFQNIIIKTDKHFLNKYKETIEKDSFSKLKETTTAYSLRGLLKRNPTVKIQKI